MASLETALGVVAGGAITESSVPKNAVKTRKKIG